MSETARVDGTDTPEVPEYRSAERLKFFTDAVVAIAMTLLVLPLLESIPEAVAEHVAAAEWFSHNADKFLSFAVSFSIVASFWINHHRLFEFVRSYTPTLMVLNCAWMFTICFLQVPSSMVYAFDVSRFTVGLYIGTMTSTSLLHAAMAFHIFRRPEIQEPTHPLTMSNVARTVAAASMYLLAFIVAMLVPSINYFALFVMALTPLALRLAERWANRHEPATTPPPAQG